MEKNLLKNGKIIFPKKLNLKKKINVGIIGSGKMAMEYIAVINSFNHNLAYLFSPSDNKNAQVIAKKNKAKYLKDYKQVLLVNDVDIWIVCTSWHKLKEVFFKISKIEAQRTTRTLYLFHRVTIRNSTDKIYEVRLLKERVGEAARLVLPGEEIYLDHDFHDRRPK